MSEPNVDPLKSIPSSDVVRERLAKNIREGRLLRQMLKLAERADKERQHRAQQEARESRQ